MGGHCIPQLTYLFGDFTSLSATSAVQWPTYVVVEPDGSLSESRVNTMPDHIAFTGKTTSGVVAVVSWRTGYKQGSQKVLSWQIDGTEGNILVESDEGAYPHITEPDIYVNGQKIDLASCYPEEQFGAVGNMTRLWKAFALGEKEAYSDVQDGVAVYHVLQAITKSSLEGTRVEL